MILRSGPDLFTLFVLLKWNYRSASIKTTNTIKPQKQTGTSTTTKKQLPPHFKNYIHSLTYCNEVPVRLQHHIFVETLLGRIQQSPFFPCKVHNYIIICHFILQYPIYMHKGKHDNELLDRYISFKIISKNFGPLLNSFLTQKL